MGRKDGVTWGGMNGSLGIVPSTGFITTLLLIVADFGHFTGTMYDFAKVNQVFKYNAQPC